MVSSKKSGGGGIIGPTLQFSQQQDDIMTETNVAAQEEDICTICEEKRNDSWIACDKCESWYHFWCVGITPETAPKEDEGFMCPKCLKIEILG